MNQYDTYEVLQVAKRLRSELLAIAHDESPPDNQPKRIFATTSTTTGLARRIYQFIDHIDRETGNILAN